MITRTVGELVAALQAYPPDTRVAATWEGTCRGIDVLSRPRPLGCAASDLPVLLLEVEYEYLSRDWWEASE